MTHEEIADLLDALDKGTWPHFAVATHLCECGPCLHKLHELICTYAAISAACAARSNLDFDTDSHESRRNQSSELLTGSHEGALAIRAAICKTLDKEGQDITPYDLRIVEELDLSNCVEVVDVQLVSELLNIRELCLDGTRVSDLRPLQSLHGLVKLSLDGTRVNDKYFSDLAGMTGLRWLSANRTSIANLDPISNLHELRSLALDGTQITDLRPLQGLSKLRNLSVADTAVKDITPLAHLPELSKLILAGTKVSDVRAIMSMPKIAEVDLKKCPFWREDNSHDDLATVAQSHERLVLHTDGTPF